MCRAAHLTLPLRSRGGPLASRSSPTPPSVRTPRTQSLPSRSNRSEPQASRRTRWEGSRGTQTSRCAGSSRPSAVAVQAFERQVAAVYYRGLMPSAKAVTRKRLGRFLFAMQPCSVRSSSRHVFAVYCSPAPHCNRSVDAWHNADLSAYVGMRTYTPARWDARPARRLVVTCMRRHTLPLGARHRRKPGHPAVRPAQLAVSRDGSNAIVVGDETRSGLALANGTRDAPSSKSATTREPQRRSGSRLTNTTLIQRAATRTMARCSTGRYSARAIPRRPLILTAEPNPYM